MTQDGLGSSHIWDSGLHHEAIGKVLCRAVWLYRGAARRSLTLEMAPKGQPASELQAGGARGQL